jgi:hypothetical protein
MFSCFENLHIERRNNETVYDTFFFELEDNFIIHTMEKSSDSKKNDR